VDESQLNPIDKTIFWSFQLVAAAFWLLFTFLNIVSISTNVRIECLEITTKDLKLKKAIIDGTAFLLTGINLYHYYKCSREQKTRIGGLLENARNRGRDAVINRAMQEVMQRGNRHPL
jgi:Eukaryotic protein of unknown function (DUF846)